MTMTTTTTVQPDPLCERCGEPVTGRHDVGRRKIYCSQSCRQRAYEERSATRRLRLDAEETIAAVARWLATEYGDEVGDAVPGYWEFQARELLGVAIRAARA